MPQPKDKDWLNGYKNKTPAYVVYIFKAHLWKQPEENQKTATLTKVNQVEILTVLSYETLSMKYKQHTTTLLDFSI